MSMKSILQCERNNIDKLKNYQLPHGLKKIGWIIVGIAFIALFFTNKGSDPKLIAKFSLLIGLLLVSISKEKIEDELITNLRMQSYAFAFIGGVVITLTNPLASYIINLISEKQQEVFQGLGDWQILWILLSVQVLHFEILKRMNR